MSTRTGSQLLFALTLLWGTVLLVTLGFLQAEQFVPELSALLPRLRALLGALLVMAAALGVGWFLVRALVLPATHEEQWLLAGLIGLGMVGFFWLVVGLVALPPLWATVLLLVLGVGLLWQQRGPLPQLPQLPRPTLLLLLIVVMLPLLQALQPPTSFDALLYHVRLPELWLAHGSLFQPQKAAPYFFPVLIEALFTPAYQLGGDAAPAVLHWCYFGLALVLLWQMTRHFLPEVSAPLTLVLATTMQMVPLLAGWSYLDLALVAYQVGMLWALLRWQEEPESRWHWVAAAFAGFAMGVKYLSFLTPLLGVIFLLALRRRAALAPLVAFTLIAGLVGSPSYLRNLIGTGNPFFPFALPSPHWDEFRAMWYAATGSGIGLSLPELLLVPWTTTLGLRDTSYYDARPGPLLLTFAPITLWFWARGAGSALVRQRVLLLVAIASAYMAFWLLGIMSSASLWQARFLMTPLFLLCPVVAWGIKQLEDITTPTFPAMPLAYGLIGTWAALATLITATELIRTEPLRIFFGNDDARAGWLVSQLGSYELLVREMQKLPPDARPLLLYEPRAYRMPLRTEADTLLYEYAWRLARAEQDPARLSDQLCAEGFSHVAIHWAGARYQNSDEARVHKLSTSDLEKLAQWSRTHRSLWSVPDDKGQPVHELLELNCP